MIPTLIERYHSQLQVISRHLAWKFHVDHSDLHQDICIRLLRFGHTYRDGDQMKMFLAWAARVGYTTCIDNYRKSQQTQRYPHVPIEEAYNLEKSDSMITRQYLAEIYRLLRRKFSKGHALCMYLMAQGYKYEEITAIVGIPMGTLKVRIFKMRVFLEERVRSLE